MYSSFISPTVKRHLLKRGKQVPGVDNLLHTETLREPESTEGMQFTLDLFMSVRQELQELLRRRAADRKFIDERTKVLVKFNESQKTSWLSPEYKTVIGLEDSEGRVVVGPKGSHYVQTTGDSVAPLPAFLKGKHVTLFGPPDSAKLAINAMNCFHRTLADEPEEVKKLVAEINFQPFWGADDEDSKTPLRDDILDASRNLTECFKGTIKFNEFGKTYALKEAQLAQPIKRLPGVALPCTFLFAKTVDGDAEPIPLHIYDFVLHFLVNYDNEKALTFYIPKIESDEEAVYWKKLFSSAEKLIQRLHPSYKEGTIRLILVLENPRAIFRAHEIMDALFPYFAGASLGWHDFLASTARLFKEDPNYRIPVKADPEIVIKNIKASHELLANVVGPRGGIKIGGMYGVLPIGTDLKSASFQVTLKGYFRDLVTQLKRGLDGFWVAHPNFVRIGMAIVVAWEHRTEGRPEVLEGLVRALLVSHADQQQVMDFINGADIEGVQLDSAMYPRFLIAADKGESTYIANNHPDEIRYNVFQCLQYLADWLSGNGCVALPASIGGTSVRVMDDLATSERSRWEVWLELYHGRFPIEDFVRIAHEEMNFIRKDLSDDKKIVQVRYDSRTAKWYNIAFQLMLRLMTDTEPVEFVTEMLMIFTIPEVRNAQDPWLAACAIDPTLSRLVDDQVMVDLKSS